MRPILLLETSGPATLVAVAELDWSMMEAGAAGSTAGARVLAEAEDATPMRHTALLLPLIKEAFAKTQYQLQDVAAVGVSDGPGSYTALRAGLSTAKGICLALSIPLVQVSTLAALATEARGKAALTAPKRILSVLSARRKEVYFAQFGEAGEELMAPTSAVADASWFAMQHTNGPVLIAGPAANRVETFASELGLSEELNTLGTRYAHVDLRAAHLLPEMARSLAKREVADLTLAIPRYIKPPYITTPKSRLQP